MHRDKTVARIVLVLSIVYGALAAPVVVRQRYPDEAASFEKRNLDDEPPDPGPVVSMPASDSEVAPDKLDGSHFTTQSSPSGPNGHLMKPISRALQLHDDPPPESGILQMRYDPPGTSGTPPSQNDPPAGSGATQVHDDPPLTSGPLSSQGDSSSESELGLNHVDSLNHVHSTSSGSDVDQHSVGLEELEEPWGWHPGNPEPNTFFTNARLKKIMIGEGVIDALAIPWGVSYAVHKFKHKPSSRDLASSDIVSRGASMDPP